MEEDDAAAAEDLGTPGDRAAVIAVGGAAHRDRHRAVAMLARAQLRRRHVAALRLKLPQHRISAAQRLEAAKAESRALVLDEQFADPQLVCEMRPAYERGGGLGLSVRQEAPDGRHSVRSQRRVIVWVERLAVSRVLVQ